MRLAVPTANQLLPAATACWRAAAGAAAVRRSLASSPSLRPSQASTCRPFILRHARGFAASVSSAAASSPDAPASPAAAPPPFPPPPPLVLYDTMTRAKEPFTPRPDRGNAVSMYVCGVTVYDLSHIGHARVYVAFDVLYRYLVELGYDVTYVRNFTDVDDKIIARAAETDQDPAAVAARFADEFHADVDALGCLRPTIEPRATDHIPAMIGSIQKIINHGHAYAVDGDVYFDVDSLPGYGALSGRQQEDNRAGERVAVDDRKRGAADFALWKAAKPGEPTWESPWGPGRPGWHIECSAMIKEILGDTVDIHGGGRDLVFPHHENELAQARATAAPCACWDDAAAAAAHSSDAAPFVRYWVHNGFVNIDAEKMSKSLGNFFTIRDVLQQYHPLALRWFLVNTQYRTGVNYTQRALEEASDRVYYLYQTLHDACDALAAAAASQQTKPSKAKKPSKSDDPGAALMAEVYAALSDDLNTPVAVAALSAPLKSINDLVHTKAGRKQPGRIEALTSYVSALSRVLSLLGLAPGGGGGGEEAAGPLDTSMALAEMRELALVRAGLSEAEVEAAIEERAVARAAKDFGAADAVRERLEAVGVMIMDTPQGTSWKPGPRLDIAEEDPRDSGSE